MRKLSRVLITLSLAFPSVIFFASTAQAATTYTFTNASATGTTGPYQSQLNAAYTGTSLAGLVTTTTGIQSFTIPSGTYRIETYGASRANNANGVTSGTANGFGAYQIGDFTFASPTTLKILIGQSATSNSCGNGGTFVVTASNSALIVAGGAGGDGPYSNSWRGYQGSMSTGTGSGGTGQNYGAGGGGFTSDGTGGVYEAVGGQGSSFINGGGGGYACGGFGGGGGGSSTGGGGGGYSGGSGGITGTGSLNGYGPGYGGLSYNSGANSSSGIRNTLGSGWVVITSQSGGVVTLSAAGSATQIQMRNTLTLTSNVSASGKITFYADNKRIAGCVNLIATSGNNICTWKPTIQKTISLRSEFTPTGSSLINSNVLRINVTKRTGTR